MFSLVAFVILLVSTVFLMSMLYNQKYNQSLSIYNNFEDNLDKNEHLR